MKYGMQGPKSNGPGRKGRRNSTSEGGSATPIAPSEFWRWGNELTTDALVLREGPTELTPPENLMERSARFGETIIRLAKRIPRGPVNNRLIDQLVGAATSIGANYCEADDSVSGKEFKQKIGTSRKESKECMFFLRMIAAAEEDLASEARVLWREAKELNLIFGSIWRK
jgi:four helix bundle protein